MNNEANSWLREGFIIQQQYNLLTNHLNKNQVSILANLDQNKHAEGYVFLDNFGTEAFSHIRSDL